MSKSFEAAIYETHGNPADVLRIVEQPWPEPAPKEVVVKMTAAPIEHDAAKIALLDVGNEVGYNRVKRLSAWKKRP